LLQHPHVGLMTDDIYEHVRFDGGAAVCPVAMEPALKNRTLLVNGVSKTYAMTGFRIGYGAAPARLAAAMNTIQSQTTSAPCSISQAASVAALTGDQTFVAEAREAYRERRDRTLSLLNAIEGLSCLAPDGAFYLYPSCVALYLLESEGVAVVDGSSYGLSPYLRLSIASSLPTLEDACARIARACAALN